MRVNLKNADVPTIFFKMLTFIFLLLVFFFEAKVTLVICPNIIWEKVITHTAMKTMEILILITMMKVVLNELTSKRLVMGHF